MADDKIRLRRVPLAVAFGLKPKVEAIEHESKGRKLYRRPIDRSRRRSPSVALMRKGPEVADYIEAHREQLTQYYSRAT